MTDTSTSQPVTSKVACDILLIEDDASLRQTLRDFLHDCGFNTFTAATRREGWEMVQTLRPRLCLLDINLPDGSGLDVLRDIVDQGLPVRVIVMTAVPLQHLRPTYPTQIVAAWLDKPAHPQQLLEAVRGVLGNPD